jgi:hypothetical protein
MTQEALHSSSHVSKLQGAGANRFSFHGCQPKTSLGLHNGGLCTTATSVGVSPETLLLPQQAKHAKLTTSGNISKTANTRGLSVVEFCSMLLPSHWARRTRVNSLAHALERYLPTRVLQALL